MFWTWPVSKGRLKGAEQVILSCAFQVLAIQHFQMALQLYNRAKLSSKWQFFFAEKSQKLPSSWRALPPNPVYDMLDLRRFTQTSAQMRYFSNKNILDCWFDLSIHICMWATFPKHELDLHQKQISYTSQRLQLTITCEDDSLPLSCACRCFELRGKSKNHIKSDCINYFYKCDTLQLVFILTKKYAKNAQFVFLLLWQ